MCQTYVSGGWLFMATAFVCILRPFIQGRFRQPVFYTWGRFGYMYMLFVMVFVAYTSFYIGDTFRSLRRLSQGKTDYIRRVRLNRYLFGPRGLGILRCLFVRL